MRRIKQASRKKRTAKAAAVKVLGAAAGLGLSLVGSASASTMPTAEDNSPNQRFVLGEAEMAHVSLATFRLLDRENFGSGAAEAMGAAAAAVVAGAAVFAVAVMPGLLAAEDAVASVVVAAAAAAGSMPSGSVISRPPAADPGEGAACAKSHDLATRLSRLPVETGRAHREQMFSSLPPWPS